MNILSTYYQNLKLPLFTDSHKDSVQKFLFLTGLAYVSWKTLSFAYGALSYALTFEHDLINRYGPNSWALITGASDGIGKEFAIQLAERRFHLILVARNLEKLEEVKKEIETLYPSTLIRIVVADFKDAANENFFENIVEQVKDLDVSVLVNNVGVGELSNFHLIPYTTCREIVVINCLVQAMMTRHLLPKLLKRCNDKVRSAIIDISSQSGDFPRPYMQLYGATKLMNEYISDGIFYENRDKIDVLSLKPGFTKTKLDPNEKSNFHTCTTQECVASGLRYLGHRKSTNGHWRHQFSAFYLNLFSENTLRNRYRTNFGKLMELRKKALAAKK